MSLRNPIRWQANTADLTQIDTVLAHLCCWCSHQAYYDTAQEFYVGILGAQNIYRIAQDDANMVPQGFLFQLNECWVMCFSCTPNLTWLARELLRTRYMKMPAPHTAAFVGSKWGNAAATVFAQYKDILKNIVDGGGKVVFTGHSLGGAIAAVLFRLHCGYAGNLTHKATCYSFGAPRVGNRKFQDYSADSFAIQIPEDIVTKLPHRGYFAPLAGLVEGEYSVTPADPFYHHGQLCDLETDGRLTFQPYSGSTKANSAGLELQLVEGYAGSFPAFNNPLVGARSYRDLWEVGYFNHHSETYLGRLEKTLPQSTQDSQDLGDLSNKLAVKNMPAPEEPPHVLAVWDPQIPNPPAPPETWAPRKRRIKH